MKQNVSDLSFNSETYSSKPQDFVPTLEIKCRSHKFQASTSSLTHSLSPPLPFEHNAAQILTSSCQTQRKVYSRSSGAHFPLPTEPFSYQSEGTNGYLWYLLTYHITSWPPGSLAPPVPGASQVFSPHPLPSVSPAQGLPF